jgi:RNA polymerase sigma factor (TIGR02999 family)
MGSTALVHEAYLALERGSPVRCNDRGHFKAIMSRLMRQIAIQYARRRGALKRGGAASIVELDETATPCADQANYLDLETALEGLRRWSPRSHLFVEMHYRAGYSVQEIAQATGVSGRTVERELNAGRTWLEEKLAATQWTLLKS